MAAVAVDSKNGEISTGPQTLVANTADTITFSGDVDVIRVISDGASDINLRLDGSAATVGGKFSYRLPAGAIGSLDIPVPGTNKVFSVISAGTPKYSIEKVS
jgi:hypothetical protein